MSTINKGPIGPYLDVSVESQEWLKTFGTYQSQVRSLPAQALEKQAVNLRIKLLNEFLSIKLNKGQAKREMKARGGRIKIRQKIRDKYKGTNVFLGGLVNRSSRRTEEVKGKKTKHGNTPRRSSWRVAVLMELAARQRSRSLLGASWVNKMHKEEKKPRNATFGQALKSGKANSSIGDANKVTIATTGNEPHIVLQNFIDSVGKVGMQRGIIARAMRAASDDMKGYLERRVDRIAKNMNAQKGSSVPADASA